MFDRNHSRRTFRFTSVVAFCVCASSHSVEANPSNKDVDAGIAIHGKAYADELAKQAQALYETSNSATLKFAESVMRNKAARLGWKPLGQNEVRLDQLRRIATQLELLGETAGSDYRLRSDSLRRTTGDIIDAFRRTPEGQKQLDPVRLQLRKLAPDRLREVEKLKKMAQDGKWEAAETEMYRYLDNLGVATACLFNPERPPFYQPFTEVRAAIDSTMQRARATKAKELLTERRQAETPDLAGVLREVQAAATSLATSGTVTVDGGTITGPEAITAFGQRWADIQVRTIRCRTLDWLIAISSQSYSGETIGPKTSQIVNDYASFEGEMKQALAELIGADAKRVNGPDAVRLYVEYLQACAPLIRRSANQRLAPVISPALHMLAGRAPGFPAEIAAYAAGTNDLLRWRGRVAGGLSAAQAEAFPSIDSLMFDATRSEAGYTGLYPLNNANPEVASLLASAPQVMARPIERLQGKQAHALDVVRLGGDGPVATARYRVRSYANVPAPLDLAAETDALKFDLMVGENLPAISVLAAVAIDSAERCDLVAVGGTITNQYLESLVTRFAALPTAASVLTPLGEMPTNGPDYGYQNQVLMRFDLTPSWAQHDFFFVELSPPAGAAE